jgi:hypothetical protein
MRWSWIVVVAACGGGEGGSNTPDAPATIDANPTCLIPNSYGDVGAKTGTTMMGPSTLTIVLDPTPPRDSFFLKLTTGRGVFAGGLATGTFPITGAEASSSTCGVCVNIIADIVSGQGPTKFYFATSGTVTLTSHSPPIGTLSNVELVEVDVGGTPVNSGCTSAITAMSFGT